MPYTPGELADIALREIRNLPELKGIKDDSYIWCCYNRQTRFPNKKIKEK